MKISLWKANMLTCPVLVFVAKAEIKRNTSKTQPQTDCYKNACHFRFGWDGIFLSDLKWRSRTFVSFVLKVVFMSRTWSLLFVYSHSFRMICYILLLIFVFIYVTNPNRTICYSFVVLKILDCIFNQKM